MGKEAQSALSKYNQSALERYARNRQRSANVHDVSFSPDHSMIEDSPGTDSMQIDTPSSQDIEPDLQIPSEDPIMDVISGNDVPVHQFKQVISAYHTRHNSSPSKPKYKVNIHRTYHIS